MISAGKSMKQALAPLAARSQKLSGEPLEVTGTADHRKMVASRVRSISVVLDKDKAIDSGGQAAVVRGRSSTGEQVALRVAAFNGDMADERRVAVTEAGQLSRTFPERYPALLRVHQTFVTWLPKDLPVHGGDRVICDVAEWCQPFSRVLAYRPNGLPVAEAVRLWEPVATTMDHLWADRHWIHRDIDESNMLVGADGRLRLIDLGFVSTVAEDATHVSTVLAAKRCNLPPEGKRAVQEGRLLRARPSYDAWQLGRVLYILLTGNKPDGEPVARWPRWGDITNPTVLDVLRGPNGLLADEPGDRMTLAAAVARLTLGGVPATAPGPRPMTFVAVTDDLRAAGLLKQAAERAGHSITRGRLWRDLPWIPDADCLIVVSDLPSPDVGPFAGKPIVRADMNRGINDAPGIVEEAVAAVLQTERPRAGAAVPQTELPQAAPKGRGFRGRAGIAVVLAATAIFWLAKLTNAASASAVATGDCLSLTPVEMWDSTVKERNAAIVPCGEKTSRVRIIAVGPVGESEVCKEDQGCMRYTDAKLQETYLFNAIPRKGLCFYGYLNKRYPTKGKSPGWAWVWDLARCGGPFPDWVDESKAAAALGVKHSDLEPAEFKIVKVVTDAKKCDQDQWDWSVTYSKGTAAVLCAEEVTP